MLKVGRVTPEDAAAAYYDAINKRIQYFLDVQCASSRVMAAARSAIMEGFHPDPAKRKLVTLDDVVFS